MGSCYSKKQRERQNNVVQTHSPEAQVFYNELLLEKILKFVILTVIANWPGGCVGAVRLDNKGVRNSMACRLVRKDWCCSVNKILLKEQIPLFYFRELGYGKSRFRDFRNCFWGKQRQGLLQVEGSLPPFYFGIPVLCPKHYKNLIELLDHCSDVVVGLHLYFSEKSLPTSNDLMHPEVSFKVLKIFIVHFENWSSNGTSEVENFFFGLTQAILNGCEQLKTFHCSDFNRPQQLLIPTTATYLTFKLPRYSKIIFNFEAKSLEYKYLILNYNNYCGGRTQAKIKIEFPSDQNLRELEVRSGSQLQVMDAHSWKSIFPTLIVLNVGFRTRGTFQDCVRDSRYDLVKSFTASMEKSQALNYKDIKQIKSVFPNLEGLSLTFAGGEVCSSLQRIFGNMQTLKKLSICIDNDDELGFWGLRTCDFWAALLLGIPKKQVKTILQEESSSLDPSIKQRRRTIATLGSIRVPAVTDMKDLEAFQLSSLSKPDFVMGLQIPDLVFHLAFMQMPKLKNLHLGGRFTASQGMTNLWEVEGRTIKMSEWSSFIF